MLGPILVQMQIYWQCHSVHILYHELTYNVAIKIFHDGHFEKDLYTPLQYTGRCRKKLMSVKLIKPAILMKDFTGILEKQFLFLTTLSVALFPSFGMVLISSLCLKSST